MATTLDDVTTAAETTETTDYYLLLPETNLPEDVLWELPAKLSNATLAPDTDLGWDVELRVRPGTFYILSVDTETYELKATKGGSVVHPEPAGENAFSTADTMTLNIRHSFTGGRELSGDAVFALDTACLSLEAGVGSQFTIDRRGE